MPRSVRDLAPTADGTPSLLRRAFHEHGDVSPLRFIDHIDKAVKSREGSSTELLDN
jgi:hypothetical protein